MKNGKTCDKSQFRNFALLYAAMLAGCASAPPVRVDVPVMVPCLNAVPVRPTFEFENLSPVATDGEKILALARDWPRARSYEERLEAAIAGCRL